MTSHHRSFFRYLVSLALLILIAAAAHAEDSAGLPAALDFAGSDTAGRTHRLADLRGKIVVLEWTNPDCPFVKRHYSEGGLEDLARSSAGDVVWLAINSNYNQSADRNRKWVAEQGLAFPLIEDPESKIGRSYGARTTPHVFILNREGKIVYQGGVDDDPDGEKKPAERKQHLSEALAAARQGKTIPVAETEPYGCSVKYRS